VTEDEPSGENCGSSRSKAQADSSRTD